MSAVVAGEALVKRYHVAGGADLVAVDHVDVSVMPGA